jgi:hypothetical protein
LGGKTKETDLSQIPGEQLYEDKNFMYFHQLSNAQKEEAIREYKKFIIIRNPFERILSIYRLRFENPDYHKSTRAKWTEAIIKHIRKDGDKSKNITFEEFLKFVLLVASNNVPNDLSYFVYKEFYLTMNKMCLPCNIQYNLIGSFDNLVDDSNYVLKLIGANFTFPLKSSASKTKKLMSIYYGRVKKDVILDIANYYKKDVNLFSYSSDHL